MYRAYNTYALRRIALRHAHFLIERELIIRIIEGYSDQLPSVAHFVGAFELNGKSLAKRENPLDVRLERLVARSYSDSLSLFESEEIIFRHVCENESLTGIYAGDLAHSTVHVTLNFNVTRF